MEIKFIICAIVVLILENLTNCYIDAYKIKVLNKNIRHGINFTFYAAVTGLCIYFFHMPVAVSIVFACSAFFNRQITFDIPLNLRRGLKWNYVSLDKPPKAFMDRIEVRVFGYNGTAPTVYYGILWVLTSTTLFLL